MQPSLHPKPSNSGKRIEESKIASPHRNITVPELDASSRIVRSSSFSEEATRGLDCGENENADRADCLLLLHPWESGKFCKGMEVYANDKVLVFKWQAENKACLIADIGGVEYKNVRDASCFMLEVLSIVHQKEIADTIGFIVMARTKSEILIFIEAIKRLIGKSVLECILSVIVDDALPTSYTCFLPAKPSEKFLANSFAELIAASQDLLFGAPIAKVNSRSSSLVSQSKVGNLTAKVAFRLPRKSCVSPLAALPGLAGILSSYAIVAQPSAVALVSGVGLLYSVARGLNYLTSSYVRNKGVVRIAHVLKAHKHKIAHDNLRFHSASIVKNSSRLSCGSFTSSFNAYSCAIINGGRDILVSMRYWVDQFALSNLTSKEIYGEFVINCISLCDL